MKKQMKWHIIAIYLLFSGITFGQNFPTEWVKNNGSINSKVNIVFLGDGYQEHEMSKYESDVRSTVEGMFNEEPYKSSEANFNVIMVKVPSNKSGAADDPNRLIDNYFGSTYNYAGTRRLLVPTKSSKIYSVLAASFASYDQVIVIVNDSEYGGSGGQFATLSTHSAAVDLALHELGHSYASLADEYWYTEQEKANQTNNGDRNTIKWKQFLGVDGVGIYAHDTPHNDWYRPHQNCKMRYLAGNFCAVCKHEINQKTNSLISGVSGKLSSPTNLRTASITNYGFYAQWDVVSGADGYEVRQWENGKWESKGTTAKNYMWLRGAALSTQYFSVRAYNSSEKSEYSKFHSVVLSAAPVKPEAILGAFAKELEVYPNPANDMLYINSPKELMVKVEIYNMSGKMVKTYRTNTSDVINISNVDAGIYVVKIKTGKQTVKTQKLVIR